MVHIFSIIIIFNSIYCVKSKYPESVPPNAIYSKKTNSYSLTSTGIKKVWNDKGQLFSQTAIDGSLRENGLSLTFFPETGAVLSRGNFVEGKREGIWEWYFPDGNLYYRSGYSPDKQRQVWISTNLLGNEHGIHERYSIKELRELLKENFKFIDGFKEIHNTPFNTTQSFTFCTFKKID